MALSWPPKDPDEVLDYQVNWSARINADPIAASTWTIAGPDSTLSENSKEFSDTRSTIWLRGGTLDKEYRLTNRITTRGGREMTQTVRLKIRSKSR